MKSPNKHVLAVTAAACAPLALVATIATPAAASPPTQTSDQASQSAPAGRLPSGNGWRLTGEFLSNIQCSVSHPKPYVDVVDCGNIPSRQLPDLVLHLGNHYLQADVKASEDNAENVDTLNTHRNITLKPGQSQHYVDENAAKNAPWAVGVSGHEDGFTPGPDVSVTFTIYT